MTTKVIKEAFNYKDAEELPKKSLEKAIETLRTNEEVQEKLKNMVCFCVSVEGGEAACSVTMKFVNKEVAAASSPELQVKNALIALAEAVAKSLKEDTKQEETK